MAGIDLQGLVSGLLEGDSYLTQMFVYGAAQQVTVALLTPYLQRLINDANAGNQFVPLTPADLADMVVKTILDEQTAAGVAALSGISAEDFAKMVLDTGEPPALEQVLQWARRGILPFADAGAGNPSVPEAIRTSRVRNEWTDAILASQWQVLTVADAVNAWVRNQVSEPWALQELEYNGIKEDRARILYNTNGRPVAPEQAITLVRRGYIPVHGTGPDVLSLQQAIVEGDTKDKWEPMYEKLLEAIPSAFQVRNMELAGALPADLAYKIYKDEGYSDDIAHALVKSGSAGKVAKTKQLAQSTVEKLYGDKLITRDQAVTYLESLGNDPSEAHEILEVEDFARWAASLSSAVTGTRTRYLARRISRDRAKEILTELGIPDEQITELLDVWDIEQLAQARILTEAQILDAVEYSVADNEWAIAHLEALGYSAVDAWVLLSTKLKGPQPNPPEGAPVPPPPPPPAAPVAPTPGA